MSEEARLGRRKAISLMTGACGILALDRANVFGAVAAQPRRAVVDGAIIRTVLRDVPPESLGVILFHEHFHLSSTAGNNGGPGAPQPTRHFTEDMDLVIKELR